MGQIVKVKVSHYIIVETNEMEDDLAFKSAEKMAEIAAQEIGLESFEIDDMEITGCFLPPEYDEDVAYEERKYAALFSA